MIERETFDIPSEPSTPLRQGFEGQASSGSITTTSASSTEEQDFEFSLRPKLADCWAS